MADTLVTISLWIIMLSGLVAAVRFFVGPHATDRLIAFDALTIISISLIGVIAHLLQKGIYLDVAIVYGLLSFLGVLVVARHLEGGL
jgi:multicomponent Na+:H+ antiporter subunit F